jgi:hypothetical protein
VLRVTTVQKVPYMMPQLPTTEPEQTALSSTCSTHHPPPSATHPHHQPPSRRPTSAGEGWRAALLL